MCGDEDLYSDSINIAILQYDKEKLEQRLEQRLEKLEKEVKRLEQLISVLQVRSKKP